jgi:arsenate reductase (thioredoxin)
VTASRSWMRPGLDLPRVAGVRYETWSLPDPAGWDTERIRPLRDGIDRRVQNLFVELDGEPISTAPEGGRG